MSEQALDVMKREKRRYSVIHEVATALDEIAALEVDARKQADQIISEAEAKAAQIVADALNEAKAMTDEVKARLAVLDGGTLKDNPQDDFSWCVGDGFPAIQPEAALQPENWSKLNSSIDEPKCVSCEEIAPE